MTRFLKAFVLFLIAAALAAFAVANREPVRFVLDPLIDRENALAVNVPLFAVVFLALLTGIAIGACVMWMQQASWRNKAKEQSKESALWKREAENLKKNLAEMPVSRPLELSAKPLRSYV